MSNGQVQLLSLSAEPGVVIYVDSYVGELLVAGNAITKVFRRPPDLDDTTPVGGWGYVTPGVPTPTPRKG